MTIARSKLVDVNVSRWYHTISNTVRGSFLLEAGDDGSFGNRKLWIENRLKELDSILAVSVGGFSVMDNHLHILLRIDPEVAKGWSSEEVTHRWYRLFPPKGKDRKPLPAAKFKELIAEKKKDVAWVSKMRDRLSSLSWFMKCLKEPLSRMVNKAENCRGTFFEGRFKSIMILDEEALLACCAYIDLNPVAAGIAKTPEASQHTSVKARVDHVKKEKRIDDLLSAKQGSVPGSRSAKKMEDGFWLIPIEDRRQIDSIREGMVSGFTLGNYLMLVEYTGRLLREGKASISAGLSDIFERIGSSVEAWKKRMQRLQGGRLYGSFISSSNDRLREMAEHLGVQRVTNLTATAST